MLKSHCDINGGGKNFGFVEPITGMNVNFMPNTTIMTSDEEKCEVTNVDDDNGDRRLFVR